MSSFGIQNEVPIPIRFTRPGNLSAPIGGVAPAGGYGGTGVRVTFSPPIQLDERKKWAVVVYQANLPFTAPNIGGAADDIPGYPSGDNAVTVTWNGGAPVTILLPLGLYGVTDIAEGLNQAAYSQGWISDPLMDPLFTIQAIEATQSIVLYVNDSPAGGVTVDFSAAGSLAGPLGLAYASTVVPAGPLTTPYAIVGPNRANLFLYTEYVVNFDIVTGSYVDGKNGNAVLSVGLGDQTANSIVNVQPQFPQPIPLGQRTISSMIAYITDQEGRFLPELGEDWSISFSIVAVS